MDILSHRSSSRSAGGAGAVNRSLQVRSITEAHRLGDEVLNSGSAREGGR